MMQTRTSILKRLERVYGMVEEIHSAALKRAAAKVRETEDALAEQRSSLHKARVQGWESFESDDREGRASAEVQRELAGLMRVQLEVIHREREAATDLARKTHAASRMRREQIKSVVEAVVSGEQIMEGRRVQATADDRFSSRLHWNRLQAEST